MTNDKEKFKDDMLELIDDYTSWHTKSTHMSNINSDPEIYDDIKKFERSAYIKMKIKLEHNEDKT